MSKRCLLFLPLNLLYPHLFEFSVLVYGWNSFRENRRLFFRITAYFFLINLPFFFIHILAASSYFSNLYRGYIIHVLISMISGMIYWRIALPLFNKEKGKIFIGRKKTGAAEMTAVVTLSVVGFIVLSGYAALKITMNNEINRGIVTHGGSVINSEAVLPGESPFQQRDSGNVIYKIAYRKNGQEFTAWYRAVINPLYIIENELNGDEEKWIFEEN